MASHLDELRLLSQNTVFTKRELGPKRSLCRRELGFVKVLPGQLAPYPGQNLATYSDKIRSYYPAGNHDLCCLYLYQDWSN